MTPRPMLPPKIKSDWIAALRSDKYQQGTGQLHWCDTNTFCCLGVLADIFGVTWKKHTFTGNNALTGYLSITFLHQCDLQALEQPIEDFSSIQKYLADMNDHHYTFKEIADWIEENL